MAWESFPTSELLARAPSLEACWAELSPKLPPDVRWHAGELDEARVGELTHVHCETFRLLSEGSGRVSVTARRLHRSAPTVGEAARPAEWIRELAADFDAGRAGSLVLGANDLEGGPWMLLDGNHRASALLLRRLIDPDADALRLPAVLALSERPLAPW